MNVFTSLKVVPGMAIINTALAVTRAGEAWKLGDTILEVRAPFAVAASQTLVKAHRARVMTSTLDYVQRENARLAPLAAQADADLAKAEAAFAKLRSTLAK